MTTPEQLIRNRDAQAAERLRRSHKLFLDSLAQEGRQTQELADAQLSAAVSSAYRRITQHVWLSKGELHRVKIKSLTKGLGLRWLSTTEMAVIEYGVYDPIVQQVWLTSDGRLCVKITVYFLSGKHDVLVPISDQHVRIPPTTSARIATALNHH